MALERTEDRDHILLLAVYSLRRAGLIDMRHAAKLLTAILDGAVPYPAGDAPHKAPGLMRPDPED